MKTLLQRELARMNGAGNSFLILNALSEPLEESPEERSDFAALVCMRTPGLKADGLVILEKHAGLDFQWDFYNNDGSPAEMCGNAARCAAHYYLERVHKHPRLRFLTTAGVIEAKALAHGEIAIRLPELETLGRFIELELGNARNEYFFINTGVPHVVVESTPSAEIALALRANASLRPQGSNITFYEQISPSRIRAVTYERGVDDFTQACGTGATAAAAFAKLKHASLQLIEVEMPGGILKVDWTEASRPVLSGPARFDFDLRLPEENL